MARLLFIIGYVFLPLTNIDLPFKPRLIEDAYYWESFVFNFLLVPNAFPVSNPIAFQSWSIGVEEQFYVLWPILVYRLDTAKKFLVWMLVIVIGIYLLRSLVIINSLLDADITWISGINRFFGKARFDNMAIGGLITLYFQSNQSMKINRGIMVLVYLTLILWLVFGFNVGFGLDNLILSIAFVFFILIIIQKDTKILDHSILVYLGKISYGMYMYHVIAVYIALNLAALLKLDLNDNMIIGNIFLYMSSILITIVLSVLSYPYLTCILLKLKID